MEHGILSGPAIEQAVKYGSIRIDPFNLEQLNPVSYDLTLGRQVAVYVGWADRWKGFVDQPLNHVLDAHEKPKIETHEIGEEGFVLRPGFGYLMHTEESIWTDTYVPVIDGKSSLGRLFVQIHSTAGYGDPGYLGQYTLEVTVTHPVRLYAGMRIAQIRFHTIKGPIKLYKGNYTGEDARGPVASKTWKQFEKDGRE
jgi:dCTP deaminase